jgi:hypothetical protein
VRLDQENTKVGRRVRVLRVGRLVGGCLEVHLSSEIHNICNTHKQTLSGQTNAHVSTLTHTQSRRTLELHNFPGHTDTCHT